MTNTLTSLTLDVATGKLVEKELTDQEKQELAKTKLRIEQEQADKEAVAVARQSALAKLAALGLTEAEIAAL
jgi:DNA-binding NarL/FixJ family response regulator